MNFSSLGIHGLLCSAVAAAFFTSCGPVAAPAGVEPKAKRVILIVCDTLRADRLGCYGNRRGTTPNLDALAREGTVFECAYSQSSMTMPSMAALMTGRTVDEIGAGAGNRVHLAEEVTTLAEEAKASGFATGAVVSNFVLREPSADSLGTRGIAQGFDHFDDDMDSKERNRRLLERVAPDTTRDALGWVDETLAAGCDEFFLWVHYIDPHGPYTPPDEYLDRFVRDHDGAAELPQGRWNSGFHEIPVYQAIQGERRPAVYEDRYDAEVAYVDSAIGTLLDGLQARGLVEESLIVFTSDHGESLGEQDWWFGHGYSLHRSNVHVPLIVRFPASASAPLDHRVPGAVQHLDVSATVQDAFGLRLAGDPRRSFFDGPIQGGGVAVQQLGVAGEPHRFTGVATDQWHLLEGQGKPPQLYDLQVDPEAAHNVANERPLVIEELRLRYRRLVEELALPSVESVPEGISKRKANEALDALGYGGDSSSDR